MRIRWSHVAVGIMNPFEKLSAALIVSGIAHKGHAFHLVSLYFQHGLHQLLLPVNAGDGEVIAHLGVADGDGFPDAAGSAGYEYGFSVCHGSASFYYIYSIELHQKAQVMGFLFSGKNKVAFKYRIRYNRVCSVKKQRST